MLVQFIYPRVVFETVWLLLGRLLAFCAIILHLAVFLQPLLPAKFQVALVCETIVNALEQDNHLSPSHSSEPLLQSHTAQSIEYQKHSHALDITDTEKHSHSLDHQCLYCKVHGHLVAFLDLHISEVFDRIQIRLLAFQQTFRHVYFLLQQLFLLPQGRAPPLFIA